MSTLKRRIEALEDRAGGGLVLLLISWLPGDDKRETAMYEGRTYTQETSESRGEFRERLGRCLKDGKRRFIWVSELDAAL